MYKLAEKIAQHRRSKLELRLDDHEKLLIEQALLQSWSAAHGEVMPIAFDLPDLEGPTPIIDDFVTVNGLPPTPYGSRLLSFSRSLERLFWRERKSVRGLLSIMTRNKA